MARPLRISDSATARKFPGDPENASVPSVRGDSVLDGRGRNLSRGTRGLELRWTMHTDLSGGRASGGFAQSHTN